MYGLFRTARRLREIGLIGIGERNANYVLRYNQRKFYPRVDDKLITKQLAIQAGLPVPELYAVVRAEHEIARLHETLAAREQFVVKPAHGSGGDGILVISGRRGDKYRRSNGQLMTREEFNHHLSNGLSGLFSLGGQPDHLLVEYCVQFDPIFDQVSFRGVPDVRIIVFMGYPVMAMIRLPTRMSDGKANLHQGAIGVGIDIPTGITRRGVWGTEIVREHPDTEHSIVGLRIPHWDALLEMASRCHELSGLGYIGVDFVLDRNLGPMILELNARPGLAIQIANGNGLGHRLAKVEALIESGRLSKDPGERVEFARQNFPTLG
ncbi:MAG TPA: alpha-L-glutamate ligase-like protein [Chiayiivirga sp.]|jgi:alpha-L-glutamate ligase-like protein|uniref:Alpha-L-glutamate ligase-like protein n=1 Tax=Denitratimonas tolerans TaxID=1338420 RepID=A0AAW9R4Z7_9GAMM|nr:alpha-L-glutamate ligase-like protein [Xanthomonadaceae bacterium]MDX9763637.1 alpha-L-glutamate ligase-like protein [Chiayiivirga sp.]HMN34584.1 alpha-L-glutamate ligase-like protein [Chiayiivirga sp.]HRN59830.1 alpha-L-glutamate ligase-like protein [Chiayiivirga sp.]HRO86609.1 alpha-L-glutamate ligase-like protein [Chiayiivirga sp.]